MSETDIPPAKNLSSRLKPDWISVLLAFASMVGSAAVFSHTYSTERISKRLEANRLVHQALDHFMGKNVGPKIHLGSVGKAELLRVDRLLSEAESLDPENPDVLLVRGYHFAASGDLDRALDSYQEALKAASDKDLVRECIAGVMLLKRKHTESLSVFEQILDKSPLCYIDYSNAYEELGNLQRAREILREGMEKFPRDPDILLDLAVLEGNLGNKDEFLKNTLEILEIRPNSVSASFNYAEFLRDHELFEEAAKYYEIGLLAGMPKHERTAARYAQTLTVLNRNKEAKAFLEKALLSYPRSQLLYHRLLECLAAMKDVRGEQLVRDRMDLLAPSLDPIPSGDVTVGGPLHNQD